MTTTTTTTQTTAEIVLDICTPEGKTWLARVNGLDIAYGFDRAFVRAIERNTSRSGRTGSATYAVEDGVYESNEGRRRLGRRYWLVEDDQVREIERQDVVDLLTAPQVRQMTSREAAQQLGVSVRTVQRRAAAGKLVAVKDARGRWIVTL